MKTWRTLATASAILALAACAGTAPKASYEKGQAVTIPVAAFDQVQVKVEANAGITLLEYEKVRMVDEIKSAIDIRRAQNLAPLSDPRDLSVTVTVTRYQKGNAFARAMMAGLGQVHLDGHVVLTRTSDGSTLSDFTMSKTFAWGGIYGASTSMEDIEHTFAEGVAEALTGIKDGKKSASTSKS